MWSIEKFIKAGLLAEKDVPTMNGIDYHHKVWLPHNVTIRVYQGGYEDYIQYAYQACDGEIRFATSRSQECREQRYTQFLPVFADPSFDWLPLYESTMEPQREDWLQQILKRFTQWIMKR